MRENMATRPLTITPSPLQPSMSTLPVKSEDDSTHTESSRLNKEDRQRYIINEIKKLLEGCDHFIGLVPGEHGVPEIIVSDNLKQHRFSILGDAYENFARYMSSRELASVIRLADPWTARGSKGKGKAIHSEEQQTVPPAASISYPFQRPSKRHRSGTLNNGRDSGTTSRSLRSERSMRTVNEAPALQLRVDNRDRLEGWFREAFVAMQQVACRTIAKIWIKRIHPKKQSTHPYNGGMPHGEPLDPNRTRPPYWPAHVIHREPDHIGRDDRTSLLVHLIMNTPLEVITNPPDAHNRQMVTASTLLECLEVKRSDLQEDRWEIIDQVCRARDMMEQFEAGEIDGEALVFLSDYSNGIRLSSNDSDADAPSAQEGQQESEDGELSGDGEMTPTSSTTHDSPTGRSYVEGPPRLQGSVAAESSNAPVARRIKARRSRASGGSGARVSSSMESQHVLELPYRMPGGVRKPKGGASSTVENMMGGPSGRRGSVTYQAQAPAPTPDLSVMMSTRLPPQQQQLALGGGLEQRGDYDAHTHTGSGTREMMQHMLSYANEACLPPSATNSLGWGMMPNMGPEPPDHIFGIHPHMTTQPPEAGMAYFGQAAHQQAQSQSQQPQHHLSENGMALMDPMHYHDINVASQRVLPVRVMDGSHQGMMAQPDINMDLSQGPFYPM